MYMYMWSQGESGVHVHVYVVTGGNQVFMYMWSQGESGDGYVQFRGPKKNCTKECILIIDRVTGEAILERISDTVQLKATRYLRDHLYSNTTFFWPKHGRCTIAVIAPS